MNIKVQCCGIALMAMLIVSYGRRRKLKLITSRVYRCCFYVTLACLVLDIASLVGIAYRECLPALLPVFICKTYVASLAAVSMLSVIYVATGVAFHLPYYNKFIAASLAFGAVVIGLIYALPINIQEDVARNLAWTDGPSTIATYLGVLVFIATNLVQIFRHREYIYERQSETVLIWMCIWIAAAVVQALNNQTLVVSFACALGVTFVYIQFENPELYLDRSTGLFSYMAYLRYGEQIYSGKKKFYVIGVLFENITWQDTQSMRGNVKAQKIYNAFLEFPGADVFKIQESEVLMLFNKEERAKEAWNAIVERSNAEGAEELPGHPAFYYVSDPRCVDSPKKLLELLRFVSQQRGGKDGSYHVIEGDMASQIITEQMTTQMILDALSEDRIVVHYQPIYSVQKQRFTSAEALVRIVDKDGSLIPPMKFIQVAEKNGLILEIGKRVFEKACRFYQDNALQKRGIEYIEVNLSIVQCLDGRLADDYIEIIKRTGIDPRRINLEITESSSAHGKQTLMDNMNRMINYGVNFSLDDFGTGASNLNYIVDMPVRIVKFDRGMIQAYFDSSKAKYVMDAAMHMIRGMGLEIVAEGIETEDQYRKMADIKINYIQGYYFSKPLPEEEFLKFIVAE